MINLYIKRLIAYLLDSGIIIFLSLIMSIYELGYNRNIIIRFNKGDVAIVLILMALIIINSVIVYTIIELIFKTTLFKKLFGLKVVSTRGDKVTFFQFIIRNMLRFIDFIGPIVIIMFVFSYPNFRRIGDVVAGTDVVEV